MAKELKDWIGPQIAKELQVVDEWIARGRSSKDGREAPFVDDGSNIRIGLPKTRPVQLAEVRARNSLSRNMKMY